MAYRRTPKVQSRIDATREQIVDAARRLVARSGYAATSIPEIAKAAGISTGSVYGHFSSKTALFQEVYQQASRHEIEAFSRAAEAAGGAPERLAGMVETFARRALEGRKLAWALLVESVSPEIDADRRKFREPYRVILEAVIKDGINTGEFAPQDARITSMCIVGAIVETLLGPLSDEPGADMEDSFVESLIKACVRAAGPVSHDVGN
jgi:AcrR family transcriptional regulator